MIDPGPDPDYRPASPDLAVLLYGRHVDATVTRCATCGAWTIVGLACSTCPDLHDPLHPDPDRMDAPCPGRNASPAATTT